MKKDEYGIQSLPIKSRFFSLQLLDLVSHCISVILHSHSLM